MSEPNYNDNNIPIGSRVETIKRGGGAGTSVGVYTFDGITLQRSSKVTERTDEIGKPNGWAGVNGFDTGSGTAQIATKATPVPKRWDWFSDQFDESTGGAAETWVITEVGQPFEKDGYRKVNVSLRLSPNPPSA